MIAAKMWVYNNSGVRVHESGCGGWCDVRNKMSDKVIQIKEFMYWGGNNSDVWESGRWCGVKRVWVESVYSVCIVCIM